MNLLIWLEQTLGLEILGPRVTEKSRWVGSPESDKPEQSAIQVWLTHKNVSRKDR